MRVPRTHRPAVGSLRTLSRLTWTARASWWLPACTQQLPGSRPQARPCRGRQQVQAPTGERAGVGGRPACCPHQAATSRCCARLQGFRQGSCRQGSCRQGRRRARQRRRCRCSSSSSCRRMGLTPAPRHADARCRSHSASSRRLRRPAASKRTSAPACCLHSSRSRRSSSACLPSACLCCSPRITASSTNTPSSRRQQRWSVWTLPMMTTHPRRGRSPRHLELARSRQAACCLRRREGGQAAARTSAQRAGGAAAGRGARAGGLASCWTMRRMNEPSHFPLIAWGLGGGSGMDACGPACRVLWACSCDTLQRTVEL